MHKQQGFLLLTAIVLIVVVAFMALSLTRIFNANAQNTAQSLSAKQALYHAESGLERGALVLLDATSGQYCLGLNIEEELADGSLLTIKNASQVYAATSWVHSLEGDSLRLVDTSGFAPNGGRIYVNREAIDYQSVDGQYLRGITRAVGATQASLIASNDVVSQFQCPIISESRVPAVQPLGQRRLQAQVQMSMLWAGGQTGEALTWNAGGGQGWQSNSTPNNAHINAISMLNFADGWAVTNKTRGNLSIWYWMAPNDWRNAEPNIRLNRDLHDVKAVSGSQAWAVGEGSSKALTLLRWRGGSFANWCLVRTQRGHHSAQHDLCPDQPIITESKKNVDLYGIDMFAPPNSNSAERGFAVGSRKHRAVILRYSHGIWSEQQLTQISAHQQVRRLDAVQVFAAEAWSVGVSKSHNKGVILRWDGQRWRLHATVPRPLEHLHLRDTNGDGYADTGWAVGDAGQAYYYNGQQWQQTDTGTHRKLHAVVTLSANRAWAVGQNSLRLFWNGQSWQTQAQGSKHLRTVTAVASHQQQFAGWRELPQEE